MRDNQRGKIIHRERRKQIIDFSGMRLSHKITPTDMDCIVDIEPTSATAMIEYRNLGYVFIETKYGSAKMPHGQKLALVRLVMDLNKTKPALLLVTSHQVDNTNADIRLSDTAVIGKFDGTQWVYNNLKTCIEETEAFVKQIASNRD